MRRVLVAVAVVASLSMLALWAGLFSAGDDDTRALPPAPSSAAGPDGAQPPTSIADGDIWMDEMHVEGDYALTADTRLLDLTMAARDVLISGDGLHAGTLTVDAVVPFAVVAEQIGPDVTVSGAADGQVRVARTVELLGLDVALSATGRVDVDAGQVVMEPTSVDIGGPPWLDQATGDVARQLVTIRHTVGGLPADLDLHAVSVVDEGFRVTLHGENVHLGG